MISKHDQPARVRFAPSPTGHTHLGSGRTALYDYLLARQTGGQFILRIEDSDKKRFVEGAEQELMDSLRWLGIDWDEGPDKGGPYAPYRQSERKEIYQQYAWELVERGSAYPCFCTPDRLAELRHEQQSRKETGRYDGRCRRIPPAEAAARVVNGEPHVIRFKMPHEGSITVRDYVRGAISVENANLDDYILVRTDGLALYHLAAMVDDHLMNITHVIRGSEWLPTFPLHVHILRALGLQEPEFVHLSIFLKPSGKGKMSKRESTSLMQDGYSIFIKDLQNLGYTPEGVVNWIALMGWSYDDHTEFFTLPDLVEKFSLEKLNPAPAAINFTKLDHFNGLHIRSLPDEEIATRVQPFFTAAGYRTDPAIMLQIAPLIRERMATLDDAVPMAGFFFKDQVDPAPDDLVGKNMTPAESLHAALRSYELLAELPEFTHERAEVPLRQLADELGIKAGQLFGILRAAVTGQAISPPLLESMAIIGREIVLERIQKAVAVLKKLSAE